MEYIEFNEKLIYDLTYNNGAVRRGPMSDVAKHITDYGCGCKSITVASSTYQPKDIQEIVKAWENSTEGCDIKEFFDNYMKE